MSRFLNIFKKNRENSGSKQVEIVKLSKRLQKAIGIDDETLEQMAYDNHCVEYGDYLLVCNVRCFNSGWENVIEIVPTYIGRDHGYANTKSIDQESGWHYVMKGTATECLPPVEVQEEVLKLINIEVGNFSEAQSTSEKIANLEQELVMALTQENYERAAEIKKELEKLK